MIVRVQTEDFDVAAIQRQLTRERDDVGALASFVGLVRDREDDPLVATSMAMMAL